MRPSHLLNPYVTSHITNTCIYTSTSTHTPTPPHTYLHIRIGTHIRILCTGCFYSFESPCRTRSTPFHYMRSHITFTFTHPSPHTFSHTHPTTHERSLTQHTHPVTHVHRKTAHVDHTHIIQCYSMYFLTLVIHSRGSRPHHKTFTPSKSTNPYT